MDVQKEYQSKLMSAEDAALLIESGDRVWMSCLQAPDDVLNALVARYRELENVQLNSCCLLSDQPFLKDPGTIGHIDYLTMFVMPPFERYYAPQGIFKVASVSFARLRYWLKEVCKINKAMTVVSPMDEDGYMYFGQQNASNMYYNCGIADKVIVQVNNNTFRIKGRDARIHVSQVDAIVEGDIPLMPYPMIPPSETDEKIADFIVPRIRDGSTLQIGIGGLANAVGYRLEGKKNLGVHTEMFTESMVHLAQKHVIKQKIISGFALGGTELYEYCSNNEMVNLWPLWDICDVNVIASYDNFVSINTCLMVDLTGQVASEGIGARPVACTGGATECVRGAVQSRGGQSFICLESTAKVKGETVSNIVFALPPATPVTVQRSDVQYIATEYGIADMYTQSIRDRALAMIGIAHPDFRDDLVRQAKEAKYIR
ncbi:MAG: hypothetical protein LBS91_06580 [Clostridiales Family XIII bacterium]|jgi:acyl-CoA hydrolase|nr:hypothetical protein [Clostridiales Family XIII bacterium]